MPRDLLRFQADRGTIRELLAGIPAGSRFGALALIPLANSPAAGAFPPLRPLIAQVLPALVALDLAAWNLPARWRAAGRRALAGPRAGIWVPIALFAFHAAIAVYLLQTKGFKSGDETHYLLQTVSLWENGDLDLRNHLSDGFDFTRDDFAHDHIAPMSREGQAHSLLPCGALHAARATAAFSLTMPVAIYAARAHPELATGAVCLFV